MRLLTSFIFGAVSLLSDVAFGQMIQQQIDSVLSQRLADKTMQKESKTLVGRFKTYKRVLGLRVRTEKGETYDEYIIYSNKLLKHRVVQIIAKRYGNDFQSEEYFYIDDKLVKYQRTVDKRTQDGDFPKGSATLYVDAGKVISSGDETHIPSIKYLQAQEKRDVQLNWD